MTVPSRARVTPFQVPIFEEVNEPLRCLQKGLRAPLQPSAPGQTRALRGLAAGELGLVSWAKVARSSVSAALPSPAGLGSSARPKPPGRMATETASLQRKGRRNLMPGTSSRVAAALYCFSLQIMNLPVSSGLPTVHASKI